jgi:crotonobetainyl-CoA:carnitine CoA-transferase CaiB-like acyl-CoA transferase
VSERASLLAGVRVVSLEQAVAAPLCTRHLADLGADVVKIERPGGGDFARGYDSVVDGHSAHFVWLNRGKRSLAIDIKSADGHATLLALLARADVFVCNLAPSAAERAVDDAALARDNPRLIRCYISGYGVRGPYRDRKAYDALIQGEAGIIRSSGTPESPAKSGASLADLGAGTYAFAAINAALFDRTRTNHGRRIDVALFDVMVEWMMPLLLTQRYAGTVPPPHGAHHATIAPYGPYRTADDRWINIAVQNDGQWRRLCTGVLHDAALADDPDFRTNARRIERRPLLEERVAAGMRAYRSDEVIAALESADVPWGRLNDLAAVVEHEQLAARNRWIGAELPDGRMEVVADPFVIDGLAATRGGRVPEIGEHTAEVLAELGDERGAP